MGCRGDCVGGGFYPNLLWMADVAIQQTPDSKRQLGRVIAQAGIEEARRYQRLDLDGCHIQHDCLSISVQ